MILKSIKLQNIRSYLTASVDFPDGSLLLSGDIGSGKSTILHAIEFALFGILRSGLSGSSLLRHGKKEGSVELHFSIDEKDFIIKRLLKRSTLGVQQSSGYIISNGTKKERTAVELKSDIISLLGYPADMLTKSKNIIFRFTVYTPQEEMKQILSEDKELRLDTLRRVFGIDKYKRIRENALVYVRELKSQVREMQGKVFDIDEKSQQRQERQKELGGINEFIIGVEPRIKQVKSELNEKKSELREFEKKIKELNEIRKEIDVQEAMLSAKVEQCSANKRDVESFETQIVSLKKELVGKNLEETDFAVQLKDKQNQIRLMDDTLLEIRKRIAAFNSKSEDCKAVKERILSIDQCPTCCQDVKEEHKRIIRDAENKKIKDYESQVKLLAGQEKSASSRLKALKEEVELIQKQEREAEILKIKFSNLKEKIAQKNKMIDSLDRIKKDIGRINSEKIRLNSELIKLKGLDETYNEARKQLEDIAKREKELEIQRAELEKEKQSCTRAIDELDAEIKKKLEIRKMIKHSNEFQLWLENYFMNLMIVIEKQVMARVHSEFNELFQAWFNILIEDEVISSRLDDEFTPVIEQNGFETAIENLSGGEKTSCALAYRLALNKVVNEVVGTIKTKDLIILDEPTDGFSTEQLDKVRDVLEQLNMRQVIIVSHESKIESFVDQVLRIRKNEHVSSVV